MQKKAALDLLRDKLRGWKIKERQGPDEFIAAESGTLILARTNGRASDSSSYRNVEKQCGLFPASIFDPLDQARAGQDKKSLNARLDRTSMKAFTLPR